MTARLSAWRRTIAVGATAVMMVGSPSAAVAEEVTPSQRHADEAATATERTARDLGAVQADLALANARLEQSAVEAAQAAEAYNGARWRLRQARRESGRADREADSALASVQRQQEAYGDAVAATYQQAPELRALDGLLRADGIGEALEASATLEQAQAAMGDQYDEFRALSTLASVASDRATDAQDHAAEAEEAASAARSAAERAHAAASAEAIEIAEQKTRLIAELAVLQQVSISLAEQRQSTLEKEAVREAALPRQAATDRQDHAQPAPAAKATPQAPRAPSPSGGASAAIAFARAQIGDSYVWGAAGPNSWDCSGLTQGAWGAGGTYLPHYSVAQYQQSTPISPSQLRPGDLLFWGSSSNPTSIYHVALYVGNGQMIHAPRTGRPVTQESMYYWVAPNFYARP